MRRTLAVISTGALAALLALGTANALVSNSSSESSPIVVSTSTGDQTTYEVGAAGTVTLSNDGSTLSVISVNQAPGWVIEIEVASGREVEVDFRNGDTLIQFNAELEDGEVRVRARERTTTSSTVNTTGSTSSTSSTSSTTSTTAVATNVAGASTTNATAFAAGAGGTVNIVRTGGVLQVTSVNPSSGWTFEVEVGTGREVEIDFRRSGERVQFNAELEDGEIRIRVRTRDASQDDSDTIDDSRSGSADDSRSDDHDSDDSRSDDDDHDSDDDRSDD